MVLLMEELSAANLLEHLGDPTFVEYFNAFLLLPAFSHRAFYNAELGMFEEVAVPGKTSTVESVPHVVSPSSSCSLILTDDNFVATLDKQQSWLWVVKERLPLFIRSDLYSQFKLCKILSSPPAKLVTVAALPKEISTLSHGHQRHSSFPGCPDNGFGKFPTPFGSSRTLSPTVLGENKDLDYSLLDSKVAMGQFRRFLRGTVGEKYWFFWLDVERARYLNKPIEQHRLLRELRDKYLKAGGNFELPTETRKKMGVTKLSKLSMGHLDAIQSVLTEGLKNYWCARFLLHFKHHAEEYSSHIRPQTSYAYSLEQSSQRQSASLVKPHSAVSRPTPTPHNRGKNAFEQISVKLEGTLLPEKQPLLPDVTRKHVKKTSVSDTRLPKKEIQPEMTTIRASVSDQQLAGAAKLPNMATTHLPSYKPTTDHQRAPSHTNRTLRYMVRHFPQVSSRGSSAMSMHSTAGSTLFSSSLVAESSCHILSVSGTPLPIPSNTEEESEYKALLKFLSIEQRKAGGVFQRYLEDKNDQHSLNCLVFWREIQNFKNLFSQTRFNPCAVDITARSLYGRHIAEVAVDNIGCDASIRRTIYGMLDPAYEDLFDLAEEYTVKCLLTPWVEMSNDDSDMFRKMERAQSARRYSAFSKPRSRGLQDLSEESNLFDDDDDFLEDESLYLPDDDASQYLTTEPLEQKPWTLTDILQNGIELDHFKIFLNEQFAAQDLMCWMEIEYFRGIPIIEKKMKDNKARQIRKQFFNRQYFFGPQSPANKQQQLQVCSAGGGVYGQRVPPRPSSAILIEAQKHVKARLEKKWLPMFLGTPEFKQRHLAARHGGSRKTSAHSPSGNKGGELSWMTNSLEAILFRRALQDHDTCANFIQFLGIKEEPEQFLVNNVLFWLEVQRFKEMYHSHTMLSMLESKMQAIINCFLLSPVPPRLQLNIPQEVADKVTKKDQIGPYVFREAQASVFRDLFSYWNLFQNFCAGHDPKNLPFKELAAETKEQRESMHRKEAAYEQYLASKRQAIPRFETEAEKQRRLKEEAIAKEMASVAIAFKLSEPSPLYETVIPREVADPNNITVFTPKVYYTDKKRAEVNLNSEASKPSTNVSSTLHPQTGRPIKKTIEIIHARPTTSPVRKSEKLPLPSVAMAGVKQEDTNNALTPVSNPTGKQVTGNKILFETHVKQIEAENVGKLKSKRLVKMQFSSGSSNFRYADGLERSPAIKVISPMNT